MILDGTIEGKSVRMVLEAESIRIKDDIGIDVYVLVSGNCRARKVVP